MTSPDMLSTPEPDASAPPPQLVRLSAMVVKTGLGLGQMSDGERRLALALPAWRLPPGPPLDEAAVNVVLQQSLEAEAAFLRTDHVELRRWLVDSGWWCRDGFGRAYTRPALDELPEVLRPIAWALSTVEPAAWALQQVGIYRAAQRERRARWSEAADQQDGADVAQRDAAHGEPPKAPGSEG